MKYIVIIFCAAIILLAIVIAARLIQRRIRHKGCGGGCLHCPFAQSCTSYQNSEKNNFEKFDKKA